MTDDKTRALDAIAEIEYCIDSVQSALRHYKQPQDYHFHTALKACRDCQATIEAQAARIEELEKMCRALAGKEH